LRVYLEWKQRVEDSYSVVDACWMNERWMRRIVGMEEREA